MFHKVNAKQLKRKLLLKYFFQFLIAPMLIGTIIDVCFLIVAVIRWRSNGLYRFFINEPFYLIGYIMGYMAIFITNIFSIITAIKLIIDKDKSIVQKEIKVTTVFPLIELLGWNEGKRFMIDSYSKKKNAEAYLFARENGKRKCYRAFLHEDWGDVEKFYELMKKDVAVRIKYFKHSKIIVEMQEVETQDFFA